MNNETITAIVAVIALVVLAKDVVKDFYLYKSIPNDKLKAAIDKAESIANASPNPIDNEAVELLKAWYAEKLKAEERANKDAAYANEERPRD